MQQSVLVLGGPDSGKTNYLARFWSALDSRIGLLAAQTTPDDIAYVEGALAHLHGGRFAPRTDRALQGSLSISIRMDGRDAPTVGDLIVPDMSGEVWQSAAESGALPSGWMEAISRANAALLFLRVQSSQNRPSLDWVGAGPIMKLHGETSPLGKLPTQVMLCELVRFLDEQLASPATGMAKLAVVVTAWDLLDADLAREGPRAYIRSQYPLLAGRLNDLDRFDVGYFGVSVVGGDLMADTDFRNAFFSRTFESTGWVVDDNGPSTKRVSDVTLPVAWVMGVIGPRA